MSGKGKSAAPRKAADLDYTAEEELLERVEFEQMDYYFGDEYNEKTRAKLRSMALHLLAVAAVDVQALNAEIAKVTGETDGEVDDQVADIIDTRLAALWDSYRQDLHFTKEQATP